MVNLKLSIQGISDPNILPGITEYLNHIQEDLNDREFPWDYTIKGTFKTFQNEERTEGYHRFTFIFSNELVYNELKPELLTIVEDDLDDCLEPAYEYTEIRTDLKGKKTWYYQILTPWTA